MSKMLIAAGKSELKISSVKLKLEYPAIPEAQASAPRITEALKAEGLSPDVEPELSRMGHLVKASAARAAAILAEKKGNEGIGEL